MRTSRPEPHALAFLRVARGLAPLTLATAALALAVSGTLVLAAGETTATAPANTTTTTKTSAAPVATTPSKTAPAKVASATPTKSSPAPAVTPAKTTPAATTTTAQTTTTTTVKSTTPPVATTTPAKTPNTPAATATATKNPTPPVATQAPLKSPTPPLSNRTPAAKSPGTVPARAVSARPGVVTPHAAATPVLSSTTVQAPMSAPRTHLEDRIAYQYNALGRRDPFQALVGGGFVGNDVGGAAPPDVGGIKVVGIVWGVSDKFALVEDARGNSLVLREGDKVMNGVVSGLTREALMVSITQDGQTESVAIPLTRKGESNGNR